MGTLYIAYLGVRSWLSLGKRKTTSSSEQQLDAKDAADYCDWLEHPDPASFDEQNSEDPTTKSESLPADSIHPQARKIIHEHDPSKTIYGFE